MKDDQVSTSFAAWGEAWTDLQRKCWDAWSGLAADSGGGFKPSANAAGPGNPWAQGMDFWSRMMAPMMTPETRGWADKLVELNRSYLQMGEALSKTLAAGQDAGKDLSQWWELFGKGIGPLQQQFTNHAGSTNDPWSGFAALWGLPIDTWKRLSSACSILPGDVEKAFRDISHLEGAGLGSLVGGWLSTPTLGYTREAQEEGQRLAQLWLAHGQALQNYAGALSRIVGRAGELLREKTAERAGAGESFESLRACYDLWVDCGEEAYAEIASSPDFSRMQAELTNSLMAVKRQEQKMVDEALGALNMPTRRELDTSHRRLHELQRQVWRMQQSLNEAGVRELREEVATLEARLQKLAGDAEKPASSSRRAAKPKNPV